MSDEFIRWGLTFLAKPGLEEPWLTVLVGTGATPHRGGFVVTREEWALMKAEAEVDNAKPKAYDPKYGDDRRCTCFHVYYRHFDSYDNMMPVGCKYCGVACKEFVESTLQDLRPYDD